MGSTTVEAPEPIDYGQSMADAEMAQVESQRGTGRFAEVGPLIDVEREYRPQWTALELQTLGQVLQGTGGQKGLLATYREDIAPTISGIESDALRARTAAEQQIIDQYGPSLAGKLRDAAGNRELIEGIVAEAQSESPVAAVPVGYAANLESRGLSELGGGESSLDAALRARALQRLSGGLTPTEQRNLQQAQRGAWAARGMAGTVPSAISEAMYVAERGEERQRLNEEMARGVSGELEHRRLGRAGLGAGLLGQAYGQRTGAMGLQEQLAQGRFGRRMGAAQLAQQTGGDPFLSLLGRPSGVSGQVPGWGGQATGFYGQAGPKIFQPESQMQQDLAMANQQTLLGARSAEAAAAGQMWGGLFQGLGSLGGGFAAGYN